MNDLSVRIIWNASLRWKLRMA